MSVALRHANRCRRGPSHNAGYHRIGDPGLKQPGHSSVTQVVETALDCLRLSPRLSVWFALSALFTFATLLLFGPRLFGFAFENGSRPLLGLLPCFLPISN